MRIKFIVVWTWMLVVSLFFVSCHAQKLHIHWGPQSMMYLKGKHGRRFVSEDVNTLLKQGPQGLYAALRDTGMQRLQLQALRKPHRMVSSEKVLHRDLRDR